MSYWGREIRLVPLPMKRSQKVPDHNGEKTPSERKASWLSKARATWPRHWGYFSGALICLHRRDSQRRKSSIISRPLDAGVPPSAWSIFSTTASRSQRRSTVPQSASAMASEELPLLYWPLLGLGLSSPGERAGVQSRCCRPEATAKTSTVRLAWGSLFQSCRWPVGPWRLR